LSPPFGQGYLPLFSLPGSHLRPPLPRASQHVLLLLPRNLSSASGPTRPRESHGHSPLLQNGVWKRTPPTGRDPKSLFSVPPFSSWQFKTAWLITHPGCPSSGSGFSPSATGPRSLLRSAGLSIPCVRVSLGVLYSNPFSPQGDQPPLTPCPVG